MNHSNYSGNIYLIASVKRNDIKFFQFKLKCKEICANPFFRFDSDGGTHRNYIDSIPLKEQQVPTPHFHLYNQDGLNIAYKTPSLLDDVQKKALEDISLCLVHFFQESNINPESNTICEVQISPELLPFHDTSFDPHSNIIFP